MGILTLLCSSYLLKNSVYEWELLVLKQMQNTKWPEFFSAVSGEKEWRSIFSTLSPICLPHKERSSSALG